MRNTPDATWHKQREEQAVEHIERLLKDPKFVVDTSAGRKNASTLNQQVTRSDKSVDLKRLMSQVRPDREFESQMPIGRSLEATFAVNKWFIFQKIVARLAVVVHPPTRALLHDTDPAPMTIAETRRALAAVPPALKGVPTTVVLVSTSGFEPDAGELAERTSERTIVLIEPNVAGGWTVHGSTETSGSLALFDPEESTTKYDRITQAIVDESAALLTGSLSAEKIASATQLPLQTVEDAIKTYAVKNPGLASKRLDGRLLLFREGSTPTGRAVGGEGMSMLDRLKTLFSRKGDNERKIAFLSERRAALTQQRELSHDEIFKLERQESDLRKEFKANDSPTVRRRITTQLLTLRKEIERRAQLLSVLNQQVNVVSTHLHNLEMLKQGSRADLPNSEEIATDAAAAEEMLAQLQADSELADSMSTVTTTGLSDEEQSLYEELLAESGEASAGGSAEGSRSGASRSDAERGGSSSNPADRSWSASAGSSHQSAKARERPEAERPERGRKESEPG